MEIPDAPDFVALGGYELSATEYNQAEGATFDASDETALARLAIARLQAREPRTTLLRETRVLTCTCDCHDGAQNLWFSGHSCCNRLYLPRVTYPDRPPAARSSPFTWTWSDTLPRKRYHTKP